MTLTPAKRPISRPEVKMASGGFHDTSTHSGSFHDSGGYDSGGGGGSGLGFPPLFISLDLLFALLIVLENFLSELPFHHLISILIFVAAFALFIPGYKEKNRFYAINKIRKKDVEIFRGSVWSADYSDNRVGNEYDWYGKLDKNYSISFFDRTYGSDNVKTVRQAVKRTPRIIWVNTTTWLAWAIVCAVCNLFFYKLVIPYFERMYMTDAAFAFFDFLIFFLPPVLALLFAFFSFIFVKAKDKVLYECAVRVVADNRAKEHKLRTERNIDRKLSNKWYYNNCPNCGAKASDFMKNCSHCGTSLEVSSFAGGTAGAIHRLIKTADNEDKL